MTGLGREKKAGFVTHVRWLLTGLGRGGLFEG